MNIIAGSTADVKSQTILVLPVDVSGNSIAFATTGTVGAYLPLSGGTLTGPLTLNFINAGNNNVVTISGSVSEGNGNISTGAASHAEGNSTTATGTASHAEGFGTQALGLYSHAQGSQGIAAGAFSFVAGINGQANHDQSIVFNDNQGPVLSSTASEFTISMGGGVRIYSGTSVIPSASGLNFVGSAALPFSGMYAQQFYGAPVLLSPNKTRFMLTVSNTGVVTGTAF